MLIFLVAGIACLFSAWLMWTHAPSNVIPALLLAVPMGLLVGMGLTLLGLAGSVTPERKESGRSTKD